MKRAAALGVLVLALTGCAHSEDDAGSSAAPPGGCTPGATFASSRDYVSGFVPEDEVGGAETPEVAAREYAANLQPAPLGGWTRVAGEGQAVGTALMAAQDYRLHAYALADGTWLVSGGYRCSGG